MKRKLNLFLAATLAPAAAVSAQLSPAAESETAPQPDPRISEHQTASEQLNPAALQARLQELHQEIDQLSERLNEIHQSALLKSDVRDLLLEYERELADRIRETAPGLEGQVDQHEEVLDEIAGLEIDGDDADADEKQKLEQLMARHNQVKQQLAPVENQLLTEDDFLRARIDYQQKLVAAMNGIDSETDEIIDRRGELAQQFMTIQQQFLESQQRNQSPRSQVMPQSSEGSAPQPQ